jgi:Transposase domain (DUF772)
MNIEPETTGVSKKERTMMTSRLKPNQPHSGYLEGDLTCWLGERELLKLALEAVQTVPSPLPGIPGDHGQILRPQMMLTLLAYCYCASLYGSRDIEWAAHNNKTIRYICARTYPDWLAIRRFRRQHRDLVGQCLAHILREAWARIWDHQETEFASGFRFEPDFYKQVAATVKTKIETAAIMDGAESD